MVWEFRGVSALVLEGCSGDKVACLRLFPQWPGQHPGGEHWAGGGQLGKHLGV